jgi:predicted amidohydrolase
MKLDILIKNGLVADLEGHDYINRNIGVIGDRIVDLNTVDDLQAETVIDAAGCIVLPGLIDFHGHVFHGGTAISVNPDIVCLTGSPAWSMPAAAAG